MALSIFHERLTILYDDEQDKDPRCGRQQFAQLCGVSTSLIDNYLSGRGWPTLDNFKTICKNLNINAGWLIGESDVNHNFENNFDKMAKDLSKSQMEAVDEYVVFLKFAAARRRSTDAKHKNIDLPDWCVHHGESIFSLWNGELNIKISHLRALKQIFKCSYDDLFDGRK